MNWYKKLQVVMLFWIILCIQVTAHKNSSFSDNKGKDENAELFNFDISKMLSTNLDPPVDELHNRSAAQNTSTNLIESFSWIQYYLAGLQAFFKRSFSGKLKNRIITSKKYNLRDQLKALQVRKDNNNQIMKRWRLFISQIIQFKFEKQKMESGKISKCPSSARPNYYDIMTMDSNAYMKGNDDTDVEHHSGNLKSYSLDQNAMNLAFLDEPRVIQFYIQEIFGISSILMNRTRYIM